MNIVKIHSPEEALVLIPHVLGYRPRHTVVLLSLDHRGRDISGNQACVGPVATVAIPDDALPPELAAELVRIIDQFRLRHVIIAAYITDVSDSAARISLAGIFRAAKRAVARNGGGLCDVFLADERRWCTREGDVHSLKELDGAPAAASLVYSGSAPSRRQPSPTLTPARPELRTLAGEEREEYIREKPSVPTLLRLWNDLLSSADPPEELRETRTGDLARASLSLTHASVRDRVLLHALSPAGALPLEDIDDEELTCGLGDVLGIRPHAQRLRYVASLVDMCVSLDLPDTGDAAATAGYLWWWMGSNSWAKARIDIAHRHDESNLLASLLGKTLNAHILPPWILSDDYLDEHA
ncbi:DUF4192 family protein [Arcanobacterium haemolyticum]|nr:DUF4192 family protein [Arcanobacterium haemolyticum]